VRSFDDARPPARFDALPFTLALVQESSAQTSGFSTIATVNLATGPGVSPLGLDSNPAAPGNRDITVSTATLTSGWYRIIWQDAAGAQFIGDAIYYPAPSSSYALCTLGQVREFMQKKSTDTVQDSLLSSQINRVSKAIIRWCEREFAPATNGLARSFDVDPAFEGRVVLVPYDLRAVTSMAISYSSGSPQTLTTIDYELRPRPAIDGVYGEVRLAAAPYATRLRPTLTITGDWGFAAVPDDVVEAAIIATVDSMRTEIAAYSVVNEVGGETRFERGAALPAKVKDLLAPYRRCCVIV
jgi:hypothetical protein